jgi:hypothetical protein
MNQAVISILERRRNKAIAVVLGVKEREVDYYIPKPIQDKLRKVVLDQFNDYHELCVDVFRSLDNDEVTLNEHYLELLDDIHSAVVKNGP